ncbi:MAG: hypothetical protein OXN83_01760, partial [Oligoflexia bacterium]|nr:hypothetical protein [Oligoflexia bacterium]
AYFIIHKHIPVLMKAFASASHTITTEQRTKSLQQIKTAFQLLESAYKRENIAYPIQDIYRYGAYFKQAGFLKDEQKADRAFFFLHHLIEGVLFPEKEIKDSRWTVIFDTFYNTIDLLLYYKTYFVEDLTDLQKTYVKLESARLFLSLLKNSSSEAFPLNSLDNMLYVLVSFFDQQTETSLSRNMLSNLRDKRLIRFFTRTLTCFSLSLPSKANCSSEWRKDSSVVTFSFPDSQFQFFSDKIQKEDYSSSIRMFLDSKKIDSLNRWIYGYKKSLFDLHQGDLEAVAVRHQFDHWLEPFFGWGEDGRIRFGDFYSSDHIEKAYQLLNYQAFLSFLLSAYLPNDEKGISFKVWTNIVSQFSPLLVILGGSKGYKMSWKKSFYGLFQVADSFLNSSDRDQHLNSKELIDLTVHFLEAAKSSQKAFDVISGFCGESIDSSCIADAIIREQGILSAYPRFQEYIFNFKIDAYKEKIQDTVGEINNNFTQVQLLPLFFLLQSMELNYHLIDQDQSFNLESDELLVFAKEFQDSLNAQVPYVFNSEQALSYLMYSFKTGNMPFFTGSGFEPVRYTHWHLSSKSYQAFTITPNDFHFLMFDFYNLYKQL